MFSPKDKISLLILIFLVFDGCQSKKGLKAIEKNKKNMGSVVIKDQLVDTTTKVPTDNSLYKNPELPVMDRVQDLLSYMTLEEKIGQMT